MLKCETLTSKLYFHSSHQHASCPSLGSGAESRYLFLQERAHYSPHGQPSQASPQHVRPRYSGLHHSQTQVVEQSQRPRNFHGLKSNQSHQFWRQNR